jgi:lipase chaperone LimK
VSLRTRFVAFFTLLAVILLIGIGAWGYVRSLAAVRALIATQVEEIARNTAGQLREQYASYRSELLLLADNAETHALFTARTAGDSSGAALARLSGVAG